MSPIPTYADSLNDKNKSCRFTKPDQLLIVVDDATEIP
jgi:hypothetical protein